METLPGLHVVTYNSYTDAVAAQTSYPRPTSHQLPATRYLLLSGGGRRFHNCDVKAIIYSAFIIQMELPDFTETNLLKMFSSLLCQV